MFLFGMTALVKAQGGKPAGTPEERAGKQVKQMTALNLSVDQKAKITAILVAQNKSQDSIRAAAGENADMKTLRPKMMGVTKQSRAQLAAVLTEEQRTAYMQMMADAKAKGGQGGEGKKPAPKSE